MKNVVCTENIDEIKIAGMALFEHGNECVPSYTIYVVLAATVFTIGIEIGPCFVYSCWFSKRDVTRDKELGVKKVLIIK